MLTFVNCPKIVDQRGLDLHVNHSQNSLVVRTRKTTLEEKYAWMRQRQANEQGETVKITPNTSETLGTPAAHHTDNDAGRLRPRIARQRPHRGRGAGSEAMRVGCGATDWQCPMNDCC